MLAHPVIEEENFEISMLIGADFYWDIVKMRLFAAMDPRQSIPNLDTYFLNPHLTATFYM